MDNSDINKAPKHYNLSQIMASGGGYGPAIAAINRSVLATRDDYEISADSQDEDLDNGLFMIPLPRKKKYCGHEKACVRICSEARKARTTEEIRFQVR
jgi:hypothetical protein